MEEDQSVREGVYISRGSLRYRGAGFGSRMLKTDAGVNWEQVELFVDGDVLFG